jgi:hypothetical protein
MKLLTLAALYCAALTGGNPKLPSRPIDRLDQAIQRRFAAPPQLFGMSRVVVPGSLGAHFQPVPGAATDFRPETPAEQELIRKLHDSSVHVGLYVFGAAISNSAPETRDFRALKGPAVITAGTVRPAWYPPFAHKASGPDALPDWNAIYPIARAAMRRFESGEKSFEASAGSWSVAARPVPASAQSCVGCHNNPAIGRSARAIALDDTIGGVLYLYR